MVPDFPLVLLDADAARDSVAVRVLLVGSRVGFVGWMCVAGWFGGGPDFGFCSGVEDGWGGDVGWGFG